MGFKEITCFAFFLFCNFAGISQFRNDKCIEGYTSNGYLCFTDEELDDMKCRIVDSYYEYKQAVEIITDASQSFKDQRWKEIGLYRLLHEKFTTDQFKVLVSDTSPRARIIRSFVEHSDEFKILKRSFEKFNCPDKTLYNSKSEFDSKSTLSTIIKDMQIIGDTIVKSQGIEGSIYFAQQDYDSYKIDKNGKGISEKTNIYSLNFWIYKLAPDEFVLKIKSIKKATKGEALKIYQENRKGDLVSKWKKLNPEDFDCPDCYIPTPEDKDGDGYSFLVDCNDNKNEGEGINPGAYDIPDNGINEDCFNGDQISEKPDEDGDKRSPYWCDPVNHKNIDSLIVKCDCQDFDENVYYRPPGTPNQEWNNPKNGWNDDNCDCIKDDVEQFPWQRPKILDYILVGKGHLKKGPEENELRKGIAYGYASTFTTAIGFAFYSKYKSDDYYSNYLQSVTLREGDLLYAKANKHHKRYLISTGIAGLTFLSQAIHLKIKDNVQEKRYLESIEKRKNKELDNSFCNSKETSSLFLKPYSDNSGIGLSLVYQFK